MKVISANLNGIRAAAKKGFFEWMLKESPDVVCIQETKAQLDQLDAPVFSPPGYFKYFFDAQKKGYSGTAIYSKKEPDFITTGLGWDIADTEGRYIQADFGDLSIASLYLPSGSSKDDRQLLKMEFLEHLTPILKEMAQSNRQYIVCGDWNIVHKKIDIKNFNGNKKRSGCLPEERAWLDKLFGDEIGLCDAFRVLNEEAEQYTWWSNRGQAWANNTGWRIDYQVISQSLAPLLESTSIYKDQRFSDHAPLLMTYNRDL
ncbi:MAG: exodeoxyribonuclease III [gamma proteobacterium symbiont of Lucinoma myriamae]|nr:exodeoxyribonuclease III [gamma proteobacterium symbiont of Lucinoma myriamae]MCU7819700.1 exodeoxyribonuclease III [gamma proteobacterium symbiont of Lucinoma myriamae]MCU7831122.1 exodeoxyribonuclease III [gamma proteobacterium symbiont of Lucinoma myriamae]